MHEVGGYCGNELVQREKNNNYKLHPKETVVNKTEERVCVTELERV